MNIEEFLNMQRDLQIKMKEANPTQGGDPYQMSRNQLAVFITWNHTALVKELGEALDEVGWKPWASSRFVQGKPALKEMVDAWHFFLNIMLAIGAWASLDGDDFQEVKNIADYFENYYGEKNATNLQRQVEGYDGVTDKCAECHRDLSEVPSRERYQCLEKGTVKVLFFCNKTHYLDYFNSKERDEPMSNHDPEYVAKALAEAESESKKSSGAKSSEEMEAEAAARHAKAQQMHWASDPSKAVTGEIVWDPSSPKDESYKYPQPESLRVEVVTLSDIGGKAAKIIGEVSLTGEPVFILRAKDIFSVQAVAKYIGLLEEFGPDSTDMVWGANEQLAKMKQWQRDNVEKVRYPD